MTLVRFSEEGEVTGAVEEEDIAVRMKVWGVGGEVLVERKAKAPENLKII